MALFFAGILILIAGYFTYGAYIERQLKPDDKKTPAHCMHDGVDFVCMPHWKNMLIQLLNIAGVGPVIGVILGVKFGAIVFIIIPIGNLIAGATHDFIAGMMSMRRNGANLPILIKENLGGTYFKFFSVFAVFLLLLVVAVFVNIPANLIDKLFPNVEIFWLSVCVIFGYYIIATLFPVDKIIGRIYPVFGFMLLLGSGAVFVSICMALLKDPSLLNESESFKAVKWTAANGHPVVPLLFVTIACGIISGFHATQSPIIARTLSSERHAKSTFYGMMVVEGLIAMVWAAAGLAVYNMFPEFFEKDAVSTLMKVTDHFLGSVFGIVTVLSVVILAITSGDTAMRSLRLSVAEIFKISQKSFTKRILTCLPLIAAAVLLIGWSQTNAKTFAQIWNYFAWANQVLAASTLMACAVWLYKARKNFLTALIPGAFMCFIVLSYILWISPANGGPVGFGLNLATAYVLAGILTGLAVSFVIRRAKKARKASKH